MDSQSKTCFVSFWTRTSKWIGGITATTDSGTSRGSPRWWQPFSWEGMCVLRRPQSWNDPFNPPRSGTTSPWGSWPGTEKFVLNTWHVEVVWPKFSCSSCNCHQMITVVSIWCGSNMFQLAAIFEGTSILWAEVSSLCQKCCQCWQTEWLIPSFYIEHPHFMVPNMCKSQQTNWFLGGVQHWGKGSKMCSYWRLFKILGWWNRDDNSLPNN